MKTDKINRLVRDFLHGDMPEEIQRRFRRWMTAPADRETKDAALFQAWKELLARPAERDYRHKLPDIHHRIDMLDRAGKKTRFISLRRFAAAAALLALVVCGEYLFLRSRYERTPSVCLVTAQGSKGEFTLPDGTRVWLNGDSRLSYPETFDAGIRRVRLDGEAFFQVRHDASHPFVVDMEVMQVEVLGTEFDARHRAGTRYAETILQSGSVRVLTPDRKSPILLRPDERILFDTQTGRIAVSEVSACDYCSWTSRRLVFTNKSLSAILVNLERWYGVHFHSEGNIDLSAKLSFHIEYESLEEAMRLISRIAPIRYDIRGGTVFLAPE